jgi:hypothetical protein
MKNNIDKIWEQKLQIFGNKNLKNPETKVTKLGEQKLQKSGK